MSQVTVNPAPLLVIGLATVIGALCGAILIGLAAGLAIVLLATLITAFQ